MVILVKVNTKLTLAFWYPRAKLFWAPFLIFFIEVIYQMIIFDENNMK